MTAAAAGTRIGGQELLAFRSRLNLTLSRRVVGLLEGRHRSTLHGHGQDFDDLSRYAPGDDIGDIDWRASASAGVPLIKRYVHETTISVVLAVDIGRTMQAMAQGGQRKSEVARDVARLVAVLTQDGQDRLALVAGDSQRTITRPARQGVSHTALVLDQVDRAFASSAPPSDLPRLLDLVWHRTSRRGLVVVVTDEAHPDADAGADGPDSQVLRRLRQRHDVIVVSVLDADPTSGVDVDDGWSSPAVLGRGRRVVAALDEARAARAARRGQVLAGLGLTRVDVGASSDVLPRFARALGVGRATR